MCVGGGIDTLGPACSALAIIPAMTTPDTLGASRGVVFRKKLVVFHAALLRQTESLAAL